METQRTGEFLLEVISGRSLAVLLDPLGGFLEGGEDDLLIVVGNLAAETFLVAHLALETPDLRR